MSSLADIFTSIADAIREKTGGTDSIYPVDMATEIEGIESGGIVNRNIRTGARIGSSLSLAIDVYESEV